MPCFTLASQKPEAMQRLREVAAERRTPLVVLPALTEPTYFPGLQLGLSGLLRLPSPLPLLSPTLLKGNKMPTPKSWQFLQAITLPRSILF